MFKKRAGGIRVTVLTNREVVVIDLRKRQAIIHYLRAVNVVGADSFIITVHVCLANGLQR